MSCRISNHVQSLQRVSDRTRRHMLLLQEHKLSLRTKSGEISEIVRTMDAIAFRANVLALNASVEASKAGETGRGPAAVAQEVRSLATRSARSASRISRIVAMSVEEIDTSSALVSEASTSQQRGDAHLTHLQQALQKVVKLTTHGMSTCEKLSDELQRRTSAGERRPASKPVDRGAAF
jgi:methyl-accepting chemotaxis protein-1 (serine sensor receptor)